MPYNKLNMTIRNCPNGFPFALKINDVTPTKDATSVKQFPLSNIKNDTAIRITDMLQSAISPFVK